VQVFDPVASTNWQLNSLTSKIFMVKYPPKDQQHGCWANDGGNATANYEPAQPDAQRNAIQNRKTQSERKIEDLGTTTILGFQAKGRRIITTIPAGKMGNDQPIVSSQESWVALSLDLGFALKEVRDDPRSGVTTREVTSLSQGEPDPALFQPPDGYEVKTTELHQVACTQ
jgi:hypothetical protein